MLKDFAKNESEPKTNRNQRSFSGEDGVKILLEMSEEVLDSEEGEVEDSFSGVLFEAYSKISLMPMVLVLYDEACSKVSAMPVLSNKACSKISLVPVLSGEASSGAVGTVSGR